MDVSLYGARCKTDSVFGTDRRYASHTIFRPELHLRHDQLPVDGSIPIPSTLQKEPPARPSWRGHAYELGALNPEDDTALGEQDDMGPQPNPPPEDSVLRTAPIVETPTVRQSEASEPSPEPKHRACSTGEEVQGEVDTCMPVETKELVRPREVAWRSGYDDTDSDPDEACPSGAVPSEARIESPHPSTPTSPNPGEHTSQPGASAQASQQDGGDATAILLPTADREDSPSPSQP